MLLGLKSDLRNKKNCIDLLRTQGLTPVTPDQGRAVARAMGATYMECSSKEQDGVEDIFDAAVTMAVGDEYKHRHAGAGTGANKGAGRAPGDALRPPPFAGGKKPKKRSCRIL